MSQTPNNSATTPAQRKWALFILTVVYAFNFIDRQLLVIMQEPIKADMGLSDTQLGLLTGLAFAAFYVTAGIPIAYLADRSNRRNIVAAALTIWSAMTAITGTVNNFTQMLLARFGVGFGEAGGTPPSHSIISDMYPEEKRAGAMGLFSTGSAIGGLGGFLIGGILINYMSWREIFFVVGIPGLLLALILRYTVKEPPRGQFDSGKSDAPTLRETLTVLKACRCFWYIAAGMSFILFFTYGAGNFMPSYFMRSHGLTLTQVAIALSLIGGASAIIGMILGGLISERLAQRDVRWYLWFPMIAAICGIPFGCIMYLTDNVYVALVAAFFGNMMVNTPLGPVIAVCHMLVRPAMRALVSSVLFFIMNLIGMGLGPLYTGMVSDMLRPQYGDESLRYALVSVLMITCFGVIAFYLATRHLRADLAKVSEHT